ncbi:hypothetical protein FB451DRAFT_1261303 [Mycena latifolia]|nr:hypothetical protein FB451DRAFT_1261303 [Mycena latifolia]
MAACLKSDTSFLSTLSNFTPMDPQERPFLPKVLLGVTIPTLALSGLLLVAFAYLAWNPASRPHLNRVSFRLLVYAIISNIVCSLVLLRKNQNMMGHAACSFVAFLTLTSSMFSTSMFCCMALNLPLVLVYGVNGNKMEKYYTVGSLFICVVCNASPWIAGELGWYASSGICWLRDTTPGAQLRWLVGTQLVWRILMSTIDVLSFATILIFMVRHEMRIRRLREHTGSSVHQSGISTLASSRPLPLIVRYRGMIMRISLYPLLSCFISITTCILDVYTVKNPVLTGFSLRLRILDMFMHPFRPTLYALLAPQTPYSFLAALRALRPTSSARNKKTSMIEVPPPEPDLESRNDKLSTTWRPSTAEEAAEEIRVESIGHQI